MKKILLSAAVLSIAFVACKKDEDTTPPATTTTTGTTTSGTTTSSTDSTSASTTAGTTTSASTTSASTTAGTTTSGSTTSTDSTTTTTSGTTTDAGTTTSGTTTDAGTTTSGTTTDAGTTTSGTTTDAGTTTSGTTDLVGPTGSKELLITGFSAYGASGTEFVRIKNNTAGSILLNQIYITKYTSSGTHDLPIYSSRKYLAAQDDSTSIIAAGESIVVIGKGKDSLFTAAYPVYAGKNRVIQASGTISLTNGGDEIFIFNKTDSKAVVDYVGWASTSDAKLLYGGTTPSKDLMAVRESNTSASNDFSNWTSVTLD